MSVSFLRSAATLTIYQNTSFVSRNALFWQWHGSIFIQAYPINAILRTSTEYNVPASSPPNCILLTYLVNHLPAIADDLPPPSVKASLILPRAMLYPACQSVYNSISLSDREAK